VRHGPAHRRSGARADGEAAARARREGSHLRLRRRGHRESGGGHRPRRVLQHPPELLPPGAQLREPAGGQAVLRCGPGRGGGVKGYRRGDPADDKTYIGPLTRAPQVKVLDAQVKDAKKKGAKVLVGGAPLKGKGNWFEPTVLVDVNHSMDVMRDESFGPVIGIM